MGNKRKAKLIIQEALLIPVLILSIIGAGFYVFHHSTCERQAMSFEDKKFYVFGGCMVKHKGKWLPIQNVRD